MSSDIPPWQSFEPLPDRPCARIIEDSVSSQGHRLTTIEAKMHRFVLAEFNTHRLFSRNSASSRAIPYEKQREKVVTQPAFPVSWPEEQKGMQGGDDLDSVTQVLCEEFWVKSINETVSNANELFALELHKSVINRLLEPFAWHTVLVTATEWNGFWAQRVSPLAQPEIHACAKEMYEAYRTSSPAIRSFEGYKINGWHLPWVTEEERHVCTLGEVTKLSAARSCRVSYLTHNRERNLNEDMDLYYRLENPGDGPPHASPLEHPAAVDSTNIWRNVINPRQYGINDETKVITGPRWGNFIGWCQLRHMIMGNAPQ